MHSPKLRYDEDHLGECSEVSLGWDPGIWILTNVPSESFHSGKCAKSSSEGDDHRILCFPEKANSGNFPKELT